MFRIKNSNLFIIFFCIINISHKYNLSDCIYGPLEEEIINTQRVFLFQVDSLIIDSLHAANLDIHSANRTRVAKGHLLKNIKAPFKIDCNSIIVEWDYIFELNKSYLIFGYEMGNKIKVKECSYSEKVRNTKYFKKMYKKILGISNRLEQEEISKLMD